MNLHLEFSKLDYGPHSEQCKKQSNSKLTKKNHVQKEDMHDSYPY